VVSGADAAPGIVAAEASGVKVGLRQKWGGGELRARSGKMVRQGTGWVLEGGPGAGGDVSPYASYAGTPVSNGFSTPGPGVQSPFVNSAGLQPRPTTPSAVPLPVTPNIGLGFPSSASASSFGPGMGPPPGSANVRSPSGLGPTWTPGPPRTPYSGSVAAQQQPQQPPQTPGTPGVYATFPPSPAPNGNGFAVGPPPRRTPSGGAPKKDD